LKATQNCSFVNTIRVTYTHFVLTVEAQYLVKGIDYLHTRS